MQRDYFNRLETDRQYVFARIFNARGLAVTFKLCDVTHFIVTLKKGTARNFYTIPLF